MGAPTQRQTIGRIAEIDGMRGIAILLVVTYHWFQRFPDIYPYGEGLLLWAQWGYLGVHLFFIISGFVIAYTLERSYQAGNFIRHRFFRLFPAMLVCSIITFAVLHLVELPFAEDRRVGVSGFLPSLTFTAPFVWRPFIDVENYIDGVYWSLFVEVRFYFWAMLVSITLGPQRLAPVFCAATTVFGAMWAFIDAPALRFYLETLFFIQYLPLFMIGILAYEAMVGRRRNTILVVLALAVLVEMRMLNTIVEQFAVLVFVLMFVVLILRRSWVKWLGFRPLAWIGTISYSLYLLHQNIGVTMISALPSGLSDISYYLAVTLILTVMIALSALVYTFVEKPGQRQARKFDDASSSTSSEAEDCIKQ